MATAGNCFVFEHYDRFYSNRSDLCIHHQKTYRETAIWCSKNDLSDEHCVEPTTEESTLCISECTYPAALFLTGLRCQGVIFTQTFGLRTSIEIECKLEWNRSDAGQLRRRWAANYLYGKPFLGSRQLKVAETSGRAGALLKKNVKPQGNAAPERQTTKIFHKSPVQKKRNFRPPQNEQAGWREPKKAFPYRG